MKNVVTQQNKALLSSSDFSCYCRYLHPLGEVKNVNYSVVVNIGIKMLLYKGLYMLDSLYDKRIDLSLFFTGDYPVIIVGLACIGTAVCLL
jgi:hypothetical protein